MKIQSKTRFECLATVVAFRLRPGACFHMAFQPTVKFEFFPTMRTFENLLWRGVRQSYVLLQLPNGFVTAFQFPANFTPFVALLMHCSIIEVLQQKRNKKWNTH